MTMSSPSPEGVEADSLAEREFRLKERELDLRVEEFRHRKDMESRASRVQISPLATAIVGGILTLLVSISGGIVTTLNEQQRTRKELEIKELDSRLQLVLKATGDTLRKEERISNLRFFVKTGLLKDPDGLIERQLDADAVPLTSTGQQRTFQPCSDGKSSSTLTAHVMTIVRDQLGVGCDRITLKSRLTEDLGADDLDRVELTMALEARFRMSIDDKTAESLKTVENIVRLIERHQGRQ